MSDKVFVSSLPDCNFHPGVKAAYDGKTVHGPWANMCEACFGSLGVGLGTGRGQRLVLRGQDEKRTWLDQHPDQQGVEETMAKFRETPFHADWMSYAGGDERFALWLFMCDKRVVAIVGLGLRDLSDWGWRDAFDSGSGPFEAARAALAEDDTFGAFDGLG